MSKRYIPILLITTVILIVIIGYRTMITDKTPIVEPRALDVETQTDDKVYLLGEEIEVSVYLFNDRLGPVRIEQGELSVETSVWIHAPLSDDTMIHFIKVSSTNVPAKSRVLWGKTTFEAKSTGTYTIECLGEKVTVKVVFQEEDLNL